jgi:hypothetical protein
VASMMGVVVFVYNPQRNYSWLRRSSDRTILHCQRGHGAFHSLSTGQECIQCRLGVARKLLTIVRNCKFYEAGQHHWNSPYATSSLCEIPSPRYCYTAIRDDSRLGFRILFPLTFPLFFRQSRTMSVTISYFIMALATSRTVRVLSGHRLGDVSPVEIPRREKSHGALRSGYLRGS